MSPQGLVWAHIVQGGGGCGTESRGIQIGIATSGVLLIGHVCDKGYLPKKREGACFVFGGYGNYINSPGILKP